jgi:hypothetical protein
VGSGQWIRGKGVSVRSVFATLLNEQKRLKSLKVAKVGLEPAPPSPRISSTLIDCILLATQFPTQFPPILIFHV